MLECSSNLHSDTPPTRVLSVSVHTGLSDGHICRTRPEDPLLIMRCAAKASLIVEGAITAGAEDLLLMRRAVNASLTLEGAAVPAATNGAAAGMAAGVVVGVAVGGGGGGAAASASDLARASCSCASSSRVEVGGAAPEGEEGGLHKTGAPSRARMRLAGGPSESRAAVCVICVDSASACIWLGLL